MPRRLFVKRRNASRGLKRLLDPLRMSRGAMGFFCGAALEHRCIPAPRVLAALDCRRLGCLEGSYLISEYVEGAENLAECIARGQASGLFQRLNADRPAIISQLARVLRRMHWAGVSMRDLKAANILLCPSHAEIGIMIVDADAALLYSSAVPERRAMQNVARLYFDLQYLGGVSRREALEFLRAYLGTVDREVVRRWVSFISKYAKSKRSRFTAKGVFGRRGSASGRTA